MKNLLYIFISFFTINLFGFYMLLNIKELGNGSPGLVFLAFSVLLSFVLIVIQLLFSKKIYINRSFLVIIIFFIYFICRIIIDTQDIEILKALTIATEGGIILYYMIGMMFGIFYTTVKNKILLFKCFEKLFISLFLLSLISFSLYFSFLFFETFQKIRIDIFLLSRDDVGSYQRMGQFMVMLFMIISFFYVLFFITLVSKSFIYKILLFVVTLYILSLFMLSLVYTQLIGSNNAFVNTTVLLISIIIMLMFITKRNIYILSIHKFTFKNIFSSKIIRKLYGRIFIALALLLSLFMFFIIYFDIDIYQFRILGFGTEGMTSVNSRLQLWNYFTTHLNYSTLLGNMGVDRFTTGQGTYIHSFIASLLTHLGLIGEVLFLVYLYFAIKEKLNSRYDIGYIRYVDNAIIIFSLIVFIGIFLIATGSVFFTWVPIWFLMGMIFPPFILENFKGSRHANSNISSIK